MSADDLIEVHVTTGSRQEARSIADALVAERLAACVQTIAAVKSTYEWQGTVEHDEECLLLVKSVLSRFDELKQRVRALHSYDVPEILALPIVGANDEYAQWVREMVAEPSTSDQLEVERKFSVGQDVPVPDSGDWPGVTTTGEPRAHDLRATYFDTPDLLLARNRITLRRRSGGSDDGWHLKLPQDGDGRLERRSPLTDDAVPPATLLTHVDDLLSGAVPQAICEVDTQRVETDLHNAQGVHLAIRCDDRVQTRNLLDRSLDRAWTEVEVELVEGDQAFLESVTAYLAGHGVPQASVASKLQEALGPLLDRG